MSEPAVSTLAVVTASLSTASLALLGVDYYSLLYGFMGAMFAINQQNNMGKWQTIWHIVLSTFVGAALGSGILALLGNTNRAVLILSSVVGGYGAQTILAKAIGAIGTKLDVLGKK